ncbi:RING-H2 finger protein ATL66 [Juglans regia]|uniref:RING-H2 finger protein ATL66 n=1 Tax=Juglans regia TaxID=51240 RepID=A0A2I4DGU3_JUGRE|nr:RING-H2 finger protein ATL66 [Juglans regia]
MASVSQDSQPMFQWHFNEFDDRGFEVRGRTLFLIVILFSVLLLFTLLFLYARWVYLYRHLPLPNPPVPQPAPRGLDPSTIKSLPIIPLRSLEDQKSMVQAECCICLGVFEDGEKVKVLPPCRHCYHSECVDRWLSGHSSCPLCRASLGVDAQLESAVPQTNYLP